MTRSRSRLLNLVAAGSLILASGQVQAQHYRRSTWDPRVDFPGHVAARVLSGGPFEPDAAVVLQFSGAATELYARDQEGQLWRVERRRFVGGHLADRAAVQLPPGSYQWVGFTRWSSRERRPRVFRALDLPPVSFEVRSDRVNFAGHIHTELDVPVGRLPTRRVGGWFEVEPGTFSARLLVSEPTPDDFAAARRTYGWLRESSLPSSSALR